MPNQSQADFVCYRRFCILGVVPQSDRIRSGEEIRVLVADNQVLMRTGICALLQKLPELDVVAEAGDGESPSIDQTA